MKNIIKDKVTKILDKLPLAKNLARKKFIVNFLLGLVNSRKVQFSEIALHIESAAQPASIERQIQAFFQQYTFDYKQVCSLLLLFLPRGKVFLSIDRTEWDFGKYQCNILMIVARNGSVGIPLYWTLLDNNSGNSSASSRCHLLSQVIAILGKERIAGIVGDREFIGIEWLKYLKFNHIPFCMRLPKHHRITLKNGYSYTITELLTHSQTRYFEGCLVDGIVTNVMMKALPKGDYLFLVGSFAAKQLGQIYRYRWCIEVLFQTFKARGFDLERTHLKCAEKLSKLLVFVSLAVAICIKLGEYHHEKVQTIKVKKHTYLAKSFFRKGLDILRRGLKYPTQVFIDYWHKCVEVFSRWIDIQISYNQVIRDT